MTLNQVVARVKSLCLAHLQVRNFDQGLVQDFLTDKTTKYPSVFLQDNGGAVSTDGHAAVLNYRMFFVDLVNVIADEKENELDVQSDMLSVALDIIAQMNHSNFSDWRLSSESNLQLLVEENDDMYAGCYIDISLRIQFTQNVCQVPSNINIVSGSTGQSGLVVIQETITRYIINPAAALDTLSLILPANPIDKQKHEIFFGGTIAAGDPVVTALTVLANVGQLVYQPVTPDHADGGDVMTWEYELATFTWRRINL